VTEFFSSPCFLLVAVMKKGDNSERANPSLLIPLFLSTFSVVAIKLSIFRSYVICNDKIITKVMVFSRISHLKYFLFPFRVVGALADE